MNILFVNNVFPEPSQTFVVSQIRYAVNSGHNVEVIALKKGSVPPGLMNSWKSQIPPVRYAAPISPFLLFRLLRATAAHPRRVLRGIRLVAGRRIRRNQALAAVLPETEPDIIVANFGENGVWAAWMKRNFFPQARLCVLFHGQDMSAFVHQHGWGPYKAIGPEIDLPLAVSKKWLSLLQSEAGMAHAKLHYLGVDLRGIPEWKGSSGHFSVLFVGRLVEKKGVDVLLSAAAALRERGLRFFLQIIGDGPKRSDLEAKVARLELEGLVSFYGSLPHGEVLRRISEADCVVVPSVTAQNHDAEGIPVVAMEAMGSGAPVVATRHSGLPELIEDGVTGLLVPERDPYAIADAISLLMQDPERAKMIGSQARRHIRAAFDGEKQNELLFRKLQALRTSPAD